MVAAALQPYMDARSAVSGASFARPLDRAGLALCNRLSDSLDRCLVHLAEPLPPRASPCWRWAATAAASSAATPTWT